MAINHMLSDVITRINVGHKCHFSYIYIACSNLLLIIVTLLYYNGVIRGFSHELLSYIPHFRLKIYIKFTHNNYFYCHISNLSTPGDRRFFSLNALSLRTRNRNLHKTVYLSTSAGVITDDHAFLLKGTSGEGLLQLII